MIKLEDDTLFVVCDQCKSRLVLASGMVAHATRASAERIKAVAEAEGWRHDTRSGKSSCVRCNEPKYF